MERVEVQDLLQNQKQQGQVDEQNGKTYGKDCTIHYGDWSRRSQMKGCDPTPNGSLKEAITKRFEVKDVTENLDLILIAEEFVEKLDERKRYFGNF